MLDLLLDFCVGVVKLFDLLLLLMQLMLQPLQSIFLVLSACLIITLPEAVGLVVVELPLELLIGLTNRVCNPFSLVLQLLQEVH